MQFQPYRTKYHQLKIEVARERTVNDFSVINPDLKPCQELSDKLLEYALQDNANRYSLASGLEQLAEAYAYKYQSKFNCNLRTNDQICTANGTQDALISIFQSQAEYKQSVLIPRPYYTLHLEAVLRSGLKPYFYDLDDRQDLLLENIFNAYKQADNIAFLILNFPNNPTGQTVNKDFYQSLIKHFTDKNIVIINDFVYGALDFNQFYSTSILDGFLDSFDNLSLVEIFSLSKAYSVPGWRIAGVVGSSKIIKSLKSFKNQVDYGAYIPHQLAAAHILNSKKDFNQGVCETYTERAKKLIKIFQKNNFKVSEPEAGCSLWVQLPQELDQSSFQFCAELLEAEGLALQPEEVFGLEGKKNIRISLTANDDRIEKLAGSLQTYL